MSVDTARRATSARRGPIHRQRQSPSNLVIETTFVPPRLSAAVGKVKARVSQFSLRSSRCPAEHLQEPRVRVVDVPEHFEPLRDLATAERNRLRAGHVLRRPRHECDRAIRSMLGDELTAQANSSRLCWKSSPLRRASTSVPYFQYPSRICRSGAAVTSSTPSGSTHRIRTILAFSSTEK